MSNNTKAAVTHSKDLQWFNTMPGEQMAIRIHSNQVGGAVTIMEARVPALSGPPKHFHKDREEIFEVLEGTFRFQCGDEEFDVTPGTSVVIPRGVPHAWANIGSDIARIMFTFAPGGVDDFFVKIGQTLLKAGRNCRKATILGLSALQCLWAQLNKSKLNEYPYVPGLRFFVASGS